MQSFLNIVKQSKTLENCNLKTASVLLLLGPICRDRQALSAINKIKKKKLNVISFNRQYEYKTFKLFNGFYPRSQHLPKMVTLSNPPKSTIFYFFNDFCMRPTRFPMPIRPLSDATIIPRRWTHFARAPPGKFGPIGPGQWVSKGLGGVGR